MDRLTAFIFRRSKVIFAVVLLLNIASLISFTRIGIETDVTSFFSADNAVYSEYLALTEKYDISESIVVLMKDDESLLTEENLLTVFDLEAYYEDIQGVRDVQSFLPSDLQAGKNLLKIDERFIASHHDDLEDYIRERYLPADEFLSGDESTGIITLTLSYDADAEAIVDRLKRVNERQRNVSLSMAGDSVIGDTLFSYLVRVLLMLPPASIVLVLLVFYLMLRSVRLALLSLLPAGLGALWTLGTIFWQGQEVNIVTAVCPVFVIVMGSADGLHYTTHLLEKMSLYPDRRRLTTETMRMVLKPIVLTSLTTMAGFASLMLSDLEPMRQMGIYVPIGIGYAGLLSIFFLPAVLSRIDLPQQMKPPENEAIEFFVRTQRRKSSILIGVALVLGIAALNLPNLKVVSDPLLFFKQDSDIRQTFRTIEEEFGGALLLIGEIPAEKELQALRDYEYAEDVLDMERELERLPGILSAQSLFDMVHRAHSATSGDSDYPESPGRVSLIVSQLEEDDISSWHAQDGLRLVARTNDLESEDVDVLRRFVQEHPELRVINGSPVLYDELNRLTVDSQVKSLGLALVLVFGMLLVSFRVLRSAIVGLIPIVITIIAIMGALALTGYQLNVVTATLSAVTVGVGVDYAIHLISGIQYYQAQGLQMREAIGSALGTVSRPVLASAFGLSVGISVMFLSPLHIHTQVATVMWVAMMVSSIGALTLIPLLYSRIRG